MAGSGTDLFSSDDEVLQTSCSSYSEPGSEDDDRSSTQFKNLDMADLFKAKRQSPGTPCRQGLQGSTSDSRVTKSKKSVTKENTSAPVTPSLRRRRTLLPYSRGSNENMNGDSLSGGSEVASALKEMSNKLGELIQRVERTEVELKSLKNYASSSGDTTSTPKSKKKTVPLVVRAETRKVYQTMIEDDENFDGFNIEPPSTFKDAENVAVVKRLIQEIHSLNPSFQSHNIRSAAYTYYKTLRQEASMNRRGLSEARKKHRRRRERSIRKLQERQSVFSKRTYNGSDKEKWQKVLIAEMMSSEESEDDKILVKSLPWRSNKVRRFFHALDDQLYCEKSAQAKRQTKERIVGDESVRTQPISGVPKWAFEKDL